MCFLINFALQAIQDFWRGGEVGLDLNQHPNDGCIIPSVELSMDQDSAQDALQDAMRQSRALNDSERYQLLISKQERRADADLNTVCQFYSDAGGRKRKQIKFQIYPSTL